MQCIFHLRFLLNIYESETACRDIIGTTQSSWSNINRIFFPWNTTRSEEPRAAESGLRLPNESEYSFGDFVARNMSYSRHKLVKLLICGVPIVDKLAAHIDLLMGMKKNV